MKVVVASQSDIKLTAVKAALATAGLTAEVVGVKVPSDVNEQPIGSTETEKGAENRLKHARALVPDADWYIAIENGIFQERGNAVDRAVVWVQNAAGKGSIRYSDGVVFPQEAYDIAQAEGFATTTVGQVMARDPGKYGVTDHADPHASLSAHPRKYYIEQALGHAMSDMMVWRTRAAASQSAAASVLP